jgi:hypothetical protein
VNPKGVCAEDNILCVPPPLPPPVLCVVATRLPRPLCATTQLRAGRAASSSARRRAPCCGRAPRCREPRCRLALRHWDPRHQQAPCTAVEVCVPMSICSPKRRRCCKPMFRRFQVFRAHVAGVVLQVDVALKAYVFNYFKCFESMLQVLCLWMLQQWYYTCFNNNMGMFQ